MHLNTIWKGIPYTLSILWVLVILAKLILDSDEYRRKWYVYFELIAALVGTCLYRKNGVVSFAVIVMFMIFFLRKNAKMWGAIAIAAVCIFFVKGPVYSYLEIESSGKYGMYIGLSQDILGAYYAGGDVSEETLDMINVMTYYNNAEYEYTPTWSYQSYDLRVEPFEFILNYIDTFLRNPISMVRAIIAREDVVWNIFAGADANLRCVNYFGTADQVEGWNEYYPKRIYRSLHNGMAAATQYTASSQWISAIEWRCGVLTLLGIISVVTVAIREGEAGKKYILLVIPVIGQIVSLLLSTGWSDFRYFWPLNLMNMCLILFAAVIRKENG